MSEVCAVVDVSQFAEAGHSVDKCGFYSVSLLKFAGKPGTSPTNSADQAASWADSEYVKYDGPDTADNGNGMVMQTLFDVLKDAGLHWQVVGSTELGFETNRLAADYIRAWLHLGYPVILAVAESAVNDLDLGGSPYAWDTTGLYHIIVATGVASDGNILVHDTASIDDNGVRPGPRRYDANTLQGGLTSATAVVLPWLPRPQDNYNPLGGPMIPQGWKDNGGILTAPNGIPVKAGFRDHVLNFPGGWEPGNWPLEAEQALTITELANHSGPGSRQIFRTLELCWYAARGVVTAWTGNELLAWLNLATTQQAHLAAQQTQIAALQAQLAAAQQSVDVAAAQTALKTLSLSMLSDAATMAALATALHTTL